jgi:hypothetical protein
MDNKFIKILLILALGLMDRSAFSNTVPPLEAVIHQDIAGEDANVDERYALPSSKGYIESCQREGLLRHPGSIEKQQILNRSGNFWVRFEIQTHGGPNWFALCSLETGEIIREQKLVDAKF